MGLYSRILDKVALCNSRNKIDHGKQLRHLIEYDSNQKLEVFIHRPELESGDQPDAFVLKFPGTGGRAERSTVHPTEFWSDANVEVWTVNPLGYGGSSGRASLAKTDRMVDLLREEIRFRSDGQPLILCSNSLGSLAAFRFGARFDAAAMLVRNPVPLREIVLSRKQWWHPRAVMRRVADAVPEELNTIRNASQIDAPILFVQSERDTVIPVNFQEQVIEAHSGPQQKFVIKHADHADMPLDEQLPEYEEKLKWLWSKANEVKPARETAEL